MNFKGSSYPEILPNLINEMLDNEDAMFLYLIELKGKGLDELFKGAGKSIDNPACSLFVFDSGEVTFNISIKKDTGILLCPKSKDETVGLLAELLLLCDGFKEARELLAKKGKKINTLITGVEWLAIDLDYNEYYYLPTQETMMNKINKMIEEYGSRKVAKMLEDDLDLILSDYEGPILREFDELAMEQIVDEDELALDEDIDKLIEEDEEIDASDEYEENADLAWDDETGFDFEDYADTAAKTYCDENQSFENCAVYREFVYDNGEIFYFSRDDVPAEL